MLCPYCNRDNDKVIDSRAAESGGTIRRRRECVDCGKRFTTYERVEKTARLVVVKKDGSRVPFDLESVLRGIQAACASAPKPVLMNQCPTPPQVLLDAPERDWLGQMQNFLRGMLPTQPGFKPNTAPAEKPTR